MYAEIAQLVEHDLAKVGVASSSLVFRSMMFSFFHNMKFFASLCVLYSEVFLFPAPVGKAVASFPLSSLFGTTASHYSCKVLIINDL